MRHIMGYTRGLLNSRLVDLSTSDVGIALLHDMLGKLRFASLELRRMEDEGGVPLSDELNAKVIAYSKVMRRINIVLLLAQHRALALRANIPLFQPRQENCYEYATYCYRNRLLPEYSYDRH